MKAPMRRVACSMLLAGAGVFSFATSGYCFNIDDTGANAYWGGDTATGGPTTADVIGTATFEIFGLNAGRINSGNTLEVQIFTNYNPALVSALGTHYGDLFISPTWTPVATVGSPAPHYAEDVYQAGDWKFAFMANTGPGGTGPGGLYDTTSGTIIMSTFGSSGFRHDQPAQFQAGLDPALYSASMTVVAGTWNGTSGTPNELIYDINDGGALGNTLAFSWAMSCANDVVQGTHDVRLPPGVPGPIAGAGLPGLVFACFGLLALWRKRRATNQADTGVVAA